jgi:hypothetical protein
MPFVAAASVCGLDFLLEFCREELLESYQIEARASKVALSFIRSFA